jgi:hypothetical protein
LLQQTEHPVRIQEEKLSKSILDYLHVGEGTGILVDFANVGAKPKQTLARKQVIIRRIVDSAISSFFFPSSIRQLNA